MVVIVLSHDSALSFWNRGSGGIPESHLSAEEGSQALASVCGSFTTPLLKHQSESNLLSTLVHPLDILVSSKGQRRVTGAATFHYLGAPLPSNALCPASSTMLYSKQSLYSFCVTSPEMCFVQMASTLQDIELAELGFELCGSYAIDAREDFGFRNRAPLTTPGRLATFADAVTGIHGARRARKVARWILPNSRSPKETQLALFATLPVNAGGFNLPAPQLNTEILLEDHPARVLGHDKITPDLYWPYLKTVVEYDSEAYHSGENQLERDARRRNVYRMLGIEAYAITKGQFNDLGALREILQQIQSSVDGTKPSFTQSQLAKQARLHTHFAWGQSSIRRP